MTRGTRTVAAVTQQIKPEIYSRVDDEATIVLTYPKAQVLTKNTSRANGHDPPDQSATTPLMIVSSSS